MSIGYYSNNTFQATDTAGILGARLNRLFLAQADLEKYLKEQKVSLWDQFYDADDDLLATQIRNPDGSSAHVLNTAKNLGVAPIIELSVLPKDLKQLLTDKNGVLQPNIKFSFGEYPMMLAEEKTANILDKIHEKYPTGKEYTFNTIVSPYYEENNRHHCCGILLSDNSHCFFNTYGITPQLRYESVPEVMYHGEKYVCLTARYVTQKPLPSYWQKRVDVRTSVGYEFILSNGEPVIYDKKYWMKVSPVEWETTDGSLWGEVLVPTKVLLGGMPIGKHYDFTPLYIAEYIKKYFFKEIQSSDAREVAKIQFKDELKDSLLQNNANTQSEIAHAVKQNIKPYMQIKTKEALFVLNYASQLFNRIQKGEFDKEQLIEKELKTPSLIKKKSLLKEFLDIFRDKKIYY